MKYKITFTYLLGSIIITLLPFEWWYYNVGDLVQIYDSPYEIQVTLFGESLLLTKIINLILLAYRFYIIVLYSGYLSYLITGKFKVSSAFFWQTILYILWPLILYVFFDYLVYDLFKYTIYYPLFIFGTETISGKISDTTIFSITYTAYPEIIYWAALAIALLYPFTYLEKRKGS
ncbi:MAG: hypothetical protein OWQ54_05105 [Sulfolobaceae archaeon]|nr:hypothetical protein [Sulfolobaceae archaeon]